MRILAVSHLFPTVNETRYGIFVARQLSELARQGADVTVMVPRTWCPRFLRRFERWKLYDHGAVLRPVEGLETFSVPFVRPPGNWFNRWAGLSVFIAGRHAARRRHGASRFDVIYASDFFPGGDAAVRLGRDLGIPAACLGIGVDVNDTPHSSPTLYRHFVRTARGLDGTLACGQSVADAIGNVTGAKPLVVYGVLDLDEFTPAADTTPARDALGLPRDRTVILYAGYLYRRKGVHELVDAFSRIRRDVPDAMLAMCGGGSEEGALRRAIREHGITDDVVMAGEVDPERMSTWMQASDLFVLPSYTEGVPNVVLEAMACGLPVVATAVGGVPGAVGGCDGALLVPPADVDALTEALRRVIDDDALRESMGVASRRLAETRFGVSGNARRILDYLETIAGRDGPVGPRRRANARSGGRR